jgi:hypothetical protein
MITFETATREALTLILSDQREIERGTLALLGSDLNRAVDVILSTTCHMVARVDGEPVFAYYWNLVDPNLCMYASIGTPVLNRHILAFMRGSRRVLAENQRAYPERLHMTVARPEGPEHAWLKLVGFHDTDQTSHCLVFMLAPVR